MPHSTLPDFHSIKIDTFVTELEALLANHLLRIDTLTNTPEPTWGNLMHPLEDIQNELERFWSPMSHLHAVANTPALRTCYDACLPLLAAYESAIGQNHTLYQAVKRIDTTTLNPIQQKIIHDHLRDFVLAGVALSSEDQKRFEAISTQLSALSNVFENHVLDAVQDYLYPITDEKRLSGLPGHAIDKAKALATDKGLSGWAIGLDHPSYNAVVTYADDRELRKTLYEAYVTRASNLGPSAGRFDNSTTMQEILALRHEAACLLGFPNYAELSIATKMADSTQQVTTFLNDLVAKTHPQALKEFAELQTWAQRVLSIEKVEPWDIAYISEKKKEATYAISQETLREYFPLPKVMSGLFSIIEQLYGLCFEEVTDIDRWNSEVTCYRLVDEHSEVRGYIYMDLFARPHKRGGAWMDSCQSRYVRADGSIQCPIATLTCNFAKSGPIARLSHDELITLFHEFGHCLHHVLTKVDYLSVSGVHGVEWDAVELPSQFFENWCWEEPAIQLLSSHVDTKKALSPEMFAQMIAAKNFNSAMAISRQLEFALFDFNIHEGFTSKNDDQLIDKVLQEVRRQTAVIPIVAFNRFLHSFTHIFSGGYAAGYYSYIWAEVLSSDAFARFEEEGVFNAATGRAFLHAILEVGGSKKASEAYVAFRGRLPTVDALLRHNGINC